MKISTILLSAIIALGLSTTVTFAEAREAPMVSEKCPAFSIKTEAGADATAFTVSPAHAGLTYNWSTSAGMISSGQGTESILVSGQQATQTVEVSLDIGGLDASCPATTVTASAAPQAK